MRVYISVDMEGVACVTNIEHIIRMEGGVEYEMSRRWMTAEVNAAVQGAFEAGASEIVVADSHWHLRNILPHELHKDVLLVRGSPRPMYMMQGIDENFDAVFLIGYHAMAGTPAGLLGHTFVSSVLEVRLNGTAVGETAFNAAVAGHFGVPVALVSGDDAVAEEVRSMLPGTQSVITKWGLSPLSARNLTPEASQEKIRAAASEALHGLSAYKPLTPDKPIRVEISFDKVHLPFVASRIPGVERIDRHTLAFTGADMLEVLNLCLVVLNTTTGRSGQIQWFV